MIAIGIESTDAHDEHDSRRFLHQIIKEPGITESPAGTFAFLKTADIDSVQKNARLKAPFDKEPP